MNPNQQRLINKDKERTKKELVEEKNRLNARIARIDEHLAELDNALTITDLHKPFTALSLQEQNALYATNPKIYEWFALDTKNPYTGQLYNNKHKTIQDYYDEGEPAGALRFYNTK